MLLETIVFEAAMLVSAARARLARYGLWLDPEQPEARAWIAETAKRTLLPFDETARRLARAPKTYGAVIRRQWYASILWYSRPVNFVLQACASAEPNDTLLNALNLHEPDSSEPVRLQAVGGLVAEKLPAAAFDSLREVAKRVSPNPPAVLIVSAEPFVPWELTLMEPPLDPARPPFLGAQTLLGRWLCDHGGSSSPQIKVEGSATVRIEKPPAQPPASISVRDTLYEPWNLWHLATAYAELGQPDDAGRCIDDAIDKVERSKEKWCEAELHRIAGEIALKSLAPDPEKAETYFERALAVARQQQTKSWELRAAMSMARLRRDQGKRDEARDLTAPVYGWFTEGFDTLDLKEAKALLDELNA